MGNGTVINRNLIFILEDGSPILDWDDGLGIDLLKGEFIKYEEKRYSHVIQDDELEYLKKAGLIISYDSQQVVITYLPEMPATPDSA
jgi:hypothetical protein